MYSTLIPAIKTILDEMIGTGVNPTKPLSKVYDYPTSKVEGYPAVVFMPVSFENSYLSVQENELGFQFRLYVVCGTKVAGIEKAFNTILANTVDEIIDKFAGAWNGGTLDGHRIWYTLDTGDWYVVENEKGEEVVAELSLSIKLTRNIT